MKVPYLTKSRFIQGMNCPKWLWKGWHEPLPYDEPIAGSIAAVGTDIGIHAQGLFPGGVVIDEAPWEHEKAILRTQKLIQDTSVAAIYEAALEFNGIRIRVDILERLNDGEWGLREVKSSTGVKPDYIYDVALQLYVLEGNGLTVSSVELVHVDNSYVFDGEKIEWPAFFNRADLTTEARDRLSEIREYTESFFSTLNQDHSPEVIPGKHCSEHCGYWDQCVADKPKEDWILTLPRLSAEKFEELTEAGFERIADIPDDFPLNATQETVRQAWICGHDYVSPDLSKALVNFTPPAYYLDFETMNPAIPVYAETRPYQRQPFQWSLHIDDGKGGLSHSEFLGNPISDSRREFTESLIEACGTGKEPIVVYSSFEQSVLKEMADLFPEHASSLEKLIKRLKDLLPIVRGYTYFRTYGGSFSIKAVGPALTDGIDYKALELIADGGAASSAYAMMAAGQVSDPEEIKRTRTALLAYCKLDTLAMVEVHRALITLT